MVLCDGRLRLWHAVTRIRLPALSHQRTAAGKVVGAVRAAAQHIGILPSYVLQAKNSGAQGCSASPMRAPTSSNALKAAGQRTPGITKTMKPAALLAFITDIRALRPRDRARALSSRPPGIGISTTRVAAFAKRFLNKVGREPTFIQAAHYSPRRSRILARSKPPVRPTRTR